MGRKAKPTQLRILSGNAGKRPLNEDEPQFDGDLKDVKPPTFLTAAAKKVWKACIDNSPPGLLKSVDAEELMRFCVAYDLYKKAAAAIKKDGATFVGANGDLKKSPWVAILDKQGEVMSSAGSNLGFSPVSRTKIRYQIDKPKRNKFAEMDSVRELKKA